MANARIVYKNLGDSATITSTNTATGYPTTNLALDSKGLVWRSASLVSTTLTVTWTSDQAVNCVFLPFTNLSTGSTIRIVCKNSVGTSIYDSGTVSAVPYTLATWSGGTGSNYYSYGGGTSVRHYISSNLTTVRTMEITLVDSTNTQTYMEVSRLVIGKYWELAYNITYGLEVSWEDTSTHTRTQSGNLLTDIGTISKNLTFSLEYMSVSDRNTIVQFFRTHALRYPVMVSLFPADSDKEKEAVYEIYGKLKDSGVLAHPQYTRFTTSLSITEI